MRHRMKFSLKYPGVQGLFLDDSGIFLIAYFIISHKMFIKGIFFHNFFQKTKLICQTIYQTVVLQGIFTIVC